VAAHRDDSSLEALLARYLDGRDERAIAALVRRVRPRLLRVARRIGNPADAEDAVQTALLSLVHRSGTFEAPVLPWLTTAVVRTAYAAKAARDKQTRLAERLAHVPADAPRSPAGAAIDAEEARRLRERVDQLPPKYRDAVVLHYFQGLSTNEAALLLDVSQPAVKKRLERARRLLRAGHPRVAGFLFAAPWALHDAAAIAAAGGGVLMPKKIAVLSFVVLLGLGGTAAWMNREAPARERAERLRAQEPVRSEPAEARDGDASGDADAAPARGEARARKGLFGVVVGPDGAPVEGARVMAWWTRRPYCPTTTGRDGRFVLDASGYLGRVPEVDVHVVADGFARAMTKLQRDQEGRIVLARGGVLRVTVRGDEGPVAGAPVRICDGDEAVPNHPNATYPYLFEEKTNDAGVVDVRLEAGRYRPCVRAPGFVPVDGEPVDVAKGGMAKATFALGRGTTFDIVVVNESGQPVEGADGWIHLGPHAPGERYATVRAGGFTTRDWRRRIGTDPVADTIVLQRAGGLLRGVVHRPDGEPARSGHVLVTVEGAPAWRCPRAAIGKGGRFEAKGVPAGKHEVVVQADEFVQQRFPVDVAEGDATEGLTFTLSPGEELRGRVESRAGEELAGVEITVSREDSPTIGKTVSGEDGGFVLRGLEADTTYGLRARSEAWRTVAMFGTKAAPGDEVVLRMKPASEPAGIPVRVRFRTEGDREVTGRVTMMYGVDGRRWGAEIQERLGENLVRYAFTAPAGTYDLEFLAAGYRPATVRGVRIVHEPDRVPVEVRLSRGAVVRLRCLDASGEPLRGVSVRWANQQVRTGDDGSCELSGLAPGPVHLRRIQKVGVRDVFADVHVHAPGRADAVFRLHGWVQVRLKGWTMGDLEGEAVFRLRRGDTVVAEATCTRRGNWNGAVGCSLPVTEAGTYAVEAEVDGKRGATIVEAGPGRRVVASVEVR